MLPTFVDIILYPLMWSLQCIKFCDVIIFCGKTRNYVSQSLVTFPRFVSVYIHSDSCAFKGQCNHDIILCGLIGFYSLVFCVDIPFVLPLQAKDIPILVGGDVPLVRCGIIEGHRDSPPVKSNSTTTSKSQGEQAFTKGWAGVEIIKIHMIPLLFESRQQFNHNLVAHILVLLLYHSIASNYRCIPMLSRQGPTPSSPTFWVSLGDTGGRGAVLCNLSLPHQLTAVAGEQTFP